MKERKDKIPTVWNDEFKTVSVDEIKDSWDKHWRGFVMARYQISMLFDDPKKSKGAREMAEIMDTLIRDNPQLRIPDNEFLDAANALFEGKWPDWYQNMVSDQFKGDWSTVKYLQLKG